MSRCERRANEALREQTSLFNLTHDTIFVRDMNDVITYGSIMLEKGGKYG